MAEDCYKVLGVSSTSDQSEIKKAYRRLAMKYHPDRNIDNAEAEQKFKEVKEAYDIISDPQRRATYDQFGHAGVSGAAGGGFNAEGGLGDIFESVFGDIFGGTRSAAHSHNRGADLQYDISLSLEAAAFGTSVQIIIPRRVYCQTCSGSGSKPGVSLKTCTECNGTGQVRVQQGFFSLQQTCRQCRGRGQIISEPCLKCHGQGQISERKNLSVKIPEGIDSGDKIRLEREGDMAGDLYVCVNVKPHDIFTREAGNLHCNVPISFATAALGGELEVPTLDKMIKLKIPPETQSEKTFRLRGKGVKSLRSNVSGDLLCRVMVETPVNLSEQQKKLLVDFEMSIHAGGKKHKPKTNSWIKKAKQFFESITT